MADTPRDRKTPSQKRGRSQPKRATARKPARATSSADERKKAPAAGEGEEFSGKSASELREAIDRGVINRSDIVMLTRERIEHVVGDAVKRGRMTADDASELVRGLVTFGRRQTNEFLSDLERLLDRGAKEARASRRLGTSAAGRARRRVQAATARARQAATGRTEQQDSETVQPAAVRQDFPIPDYDELNAVQIQRRLGDLSRDQLRWVRDYESEMAGRKTVLRAIDARLG